LSQRELAERSGVPQPTIARIEAGRVSPRFETLETLLGVGYETCCWGARLVHRRYVRDASGDLENAFLFQLELKGLSSVGNKVEDFLAQSLRGYPLD